MEFKEKENRLAAELKQLCVESRDGKWKENKPKESAKIIYKMGLLYMEKSPDKLSLIRSCALLNSAIVRNPSKVATIIKDLDRLCLHLLKVSKADQSLSNLTNISAKVAEKVKFMRENTENKLMQLEHIPYEISEAKLKQLECNKLQTICAIEEEITSQYISIMQFIAEKCVKIMGKPPCKFANAGMGSLARKEITPYSDFEHIILLDDNNKIDNKTLEYFKWFSVFFHFIIINLGETIIPSVAIQSLNDFSNKMNGDWFFDSFTKRGISFDGMMPHACKFPLGRLEGTINKPWSTELIQPVSEIIKYLDFDVDLKNGYHLADVLKHTCFVYGDKEIYKQYCKQVKQKLETKDSFETKLVFIRELNKINSQPNTDALNLNNQQFNMKKIVYRTISLFLTIICDFYKIITTGFEAINELEKQELINSRTSHHLKYALSVACEVRLKLYTKKQAQDDYIDKGKTFCGLDFDPAQELIQAVGAASLVRFFEILINLNISTQFITEQAEINFLSQFNIPDQQTLSLPYWSSLYNLHQNKKILSEWEKKKSLNWLNKDFHGTNLKFIVCNAYFGEQNFEVALQLLEQIRPYVQPFDELYCGCFQLTIECLSALKQYEQITIKSQPFLHRFPIPNWDIGMQLIILGKCAYSQCYCNKPEDALLTLLKHSKIDKNLLLAYPDKMSNIHQLKGSCYCKLGEYEEAISQFDTAQILLTKLSVKSILLQHNIYIGLHTCYKALGKQDKTIMYYKLCDEIYQQCSETEKQKLGKLNA